jgi:dTDP-glucose 4,6-dehydratase
MSNCSNNYGPYHFPEKLIPVVILSCLAERPIPLYGEGINVRDWLYVDDHADAILRIISEGAIGRSYNVGGGAELSNRDLVTRICTILDGKRAREGGGTYTSLIQRVKDRPGHDLRYAIDFSRIQDELGWRPSVSIDEGLERTVQWYLDHEDWWRPLLARSSEGAT